MSARPQEWECVAAPGCNYKVGIKIFRSVKALRKDLSCGNSYYEGDVCASCTRHVEGDRIATLNFCREELTPDIIAHEIFHAVSELARRLRLNLDDDYAEELCAHAVSWLVTKVNEVAKEAKIK